jgi:hypothetical protein
VVLRVSATMYCIRLVFLIIRDPIRRVVFFDNSAPVVVKKDMSVCVNLYLTSTRFVLFSAHCSNEAASEPDAIPVEETGDKKMAYTSNFGEKTINFYDPESGKEITGEVLTEGFVADQKWLGVRVDGVRWAVPEGWPNNALPVCEESSPAEYAELEETIKVI